MFAKDHARVSNCFLIVFILHLCSKKGDLKGSFNYRPTVTFIRVDKAKKKCNLNNKFLSLIEFEFNPQYAHLLDTPD